jgi:hypothetical protein
MPTAFATPGVGDAAQFVWSELVSSRRHLNQSSALGIGTGELASVWEVCRDSNWDGHNARPVRLETVHIARRFLEELPLGTPTPSVGAEPDGQLTFEWHRTPRWTLSISVDPEGRLHYAAMFGPNRTMGTVEFFGEVPEDILSLIRKVDAA